jgi:NitT/TauT family transport system substrate-binding protein
MKSVLATTVVIGALALSACGTTGADANTEGGATETLTPITLAHANTAESAAVQLGIEQGYFREEGFDVEYINVGPPPSTLAALQSNEVALGVIPAVPAINAISQGVHLDILATAEGYPEGDFEEAAKHDTFGVYVSAQSDATRPRDLEGMSIAVPARRASFEVFISDAVAADGGDPAKVEWLAMDGSSAVAAIEQRRLDGAGLNMPFTREAADSGARLLFQPGVEFYEEGATSLWVASPELAADSSAMERLQRAIYRSNAYANDHLDEARAAASATTGIPLEILEGGPFNYWNVTLRQVDLDRIAGKMLDLGFIGTPVSFDGLVYAQPN